MPLDLFLTFRPSTRFLMTYKLNISICYYNLDLLMINLLPLYELL